MQIETFKVEEWMNEYEQYCRYDLGNTTVNTLTIDELFEICGNNKTEFLNSLCSKPLSYGDIKGNPEFKQGIANLYETITQDEILPTIGAAGANHLVFYSLIEPSDRVISVLPTYQQLYSIPASFGAEVKYLHLTPENGFLPDTDELKSLITKNTKMICLNNPNNPSGSLTDEKLLLEIVEIARQADCYILCDEVYRGLNQTDEKTPSIADLYEKGISTSSMSKTFSLAGLRLGWIASKDKHVIESCTSHREYNLISCSIADETLASLALKNADKITERNRKTITENLEILDGWIKNQPNFTYVKPKAGTTAMIYYNLPIKSKEFCNRLAKEKGVFLTPGYCFETEYCFRIGYCKDKEQLIGGLSQISAFIKEINYLYNPLK